MPWMVEAHSDLALLRRLAVGLPKFGINDTCLHTGTVEQQFFFSNGRLPPSFMCNDYNGLSAIHIFEMLSSHGGCWPAIMQEYLIFVMLGHPVPCRCSAHHNSLYLCLWLFKKNRMKRLCVAHIINPQYRLTELHVFLSSCCLLGYRLGKETKVLNVPFVHQGIVQSLDFWKMKVFLLFNILTNGGSSCAHTGQCKDLWVRRPLGGNYSRYFSFKENWNFARLRYSAPIVYLVALVYKQLNLEIIHFVASLSSWKLQHLPCPGDFPVPHSCEDPHPLPASALLEVLQDFTHFLCLSLSSSGTTVHIFSTDWPHTNPLR